MAEHPFKSARLLYRAADDTPEEDSFFHSIRLDPFGFANSSHGLLKPQSKKTAVEALKKGLDEKSLMGVVICLQSSAEGLEVKPTPIGWVALGAISPTMAHHRQTHIAIGLLPEYQGKGYGSEAIMWITDWGFRIAGLHRLEISAFSYNEGACRLYPRLGFRPEGRLIKSIWFDGEWHDTVIFAMLDEEWRELQTQKQAGLG
jgi:GNAT superfamily N-acetyltransferase